MKQAKTIGLMLLVAGCSCPDEMLVSNSFTPKEEQMLAGALDEWEEATDADLGLELTFGWMPIFEISEDTFHGKDGKATIHIMDKDSYGYRDIAHYYEGFKGYTRFNNTWSVVLVRQDSKNKDRKEELEELYAVMLHEFGHYFGQYHHKDGGVMAEGAEFACIDSLTLEDMCRSLDCGPNAHQTCTDKGYPDTYDSVFSNY